MKVSFDYDGTLTRDAVKEYARELLQRGIHIDIHSRRVERPGFISEHDDILHFGGALMQYSRNQAMVTVHLCGLDKIKMINESGAIWHLDDEAWEIDLINRKTQYGTVGILYRPHENFKEICELFIQQKSKEPC